MHDTVFSLSYIVSTNQNYLTTKLECFYNHDSLIKLLKEYNLKNEIKVIE